MWQIKTFFGKNPEIFGLTGKNRITGIFRLSGKNGENERFFQLK